MRILVFLVAVVVLWPGLAAAHVKWFVNYDLMCPPRPPFRVLLGEYFLAFCLFVAPLMFAVAYIDRYLANTQGWMLRTARLMNKRVSPCLPTVLRIGVSVFFTSVFFYGETYGGMILTPELKTESEWVRWIQLSIAFLAPVPRTAFLAGFGIAFLYVYAVSVFGMFHLLDYPIFLGVAAYLTLHSLYGQEKSELAHAVMRLCTGVTLLWAGIEKFAYPEWSFLLLAQRPGMTFGFNPEFYMVAAGFVEFCAAFLLITGMLSARAAAALLLFFFISAIGSFGIIDAIGHSVIIIVLVLLVLSRNSVAHRFDRRGLGATAAAHTALFFGSLFAFITLYYGGHYLSYQL